MKQLWSPQELDSFWLLTDEEIALCTGAYSTNRLAFALQLKYLEHEGRFPRHKGEISAKVIGYVARQLDTTVDSLNDYELKRPKLGATPCHDTNSPRLRAIQYRRSGSTPRGARAIVSRVLG